MACCFSTRASVATVLTTHPCVSRCLRVKHCFCTHPPLLFLHISASLGCFCPRTNFEKLIGQFTSDLLYMRFTYCIKDNQQGCSRHSNWFFLGCLGPWMNHLPPVWRSTLGLDFLLSVGPKVSYGGERFFTMPRLYSCFMHVHVLPVIFPLKLIYC